MKRATKTRGTVTITREALREALHHGLRHGTTHKGLRVKCRNVRPVHVPHKMRPVHAPHKMRIEEIKVEPGLKHKQAAIVLVTLLILGFLAYLAEHYLGINADIAYAVGSATCAAPLANLLAEV